MQIELIIYDVFGLVTSSSLETNSRAAGYFGGKRIPPVRLQLKSWNAIDALRTLSLSHWSIFEPARFSPFSAEIFPKHIRDVRQPKACVGLLNRANQFSTLRQTWIGVGRLHAIKRLFHSRSRISEVDSHAWRFNLLLHVVLDSESAKKRLFGFVEKLQGRLEELNANDNGEAEPLIKSTEELSHRERPRIIAFGSNGSLSSPPSQRCMQPKVINRKNR